MVNFKNILNNFNDKGQFNIPTTGYEDVLEKSCTPSFSHIKHLYALRKHFKSGLCVEKILLKSF